jgi:acetylglutamate kinase
MSEFVDSQLRLDLLREALPYIQRFKGKTFVVKFSGKVTEDHDRLISLCEETCAAVSSRNSPSA